MMDPTLPAIWSENVRPRVQSSIAYQSTSAPPRTSPPRLASYAYQTPVATRTETHRMQNTKKTTGGWPAECRLLGAKPIAISDHACHAQNGARISAWSVGASRGSGRRTRTMSVLRQAEMSEWATAPWYALKSNASENRDEKMESASSR